MNFKNTAFRIFFGAFMLFSVFSFGQNKKKSNAWDQREIGLQLVGLDNFDFDFLYKEKVDKNAYRRFSLGFANLALQNIGDDGSGAFSAGINIGREKRRPLSDKLNLAHGVTWVGNFSVNSLSSTTVSTVATGVGFILGVHYQLSDEFYVGAEIFPRILMNFAITDDGIENFGFNAGFNSRSVGISLVYKFVKK